MHKVSIKGVLVGGLVDIVASVTLGFPLAFYAILKAGILNQPANEITEVVIAAAIKADVPLYLAQLLVSLSCSALGGYVAAGIAKHDEVLNGGLSAFLCVALSAYVIASGEATDALWVSALMFLASPALALFGGLLRRRQVGRRRSVAVAAALISDR